MTRRLLLLTSLIVLTGCTAMPSVGTQEHAGRFSLRVVRNSKSENISGRWRLQKAPHVTELTLMTPLYGVLARITVTAAGATLERPNKTNDNLFDSASTAEELMLRHLGFALPIDMLSSWLYGHPWEHRPFQRTTEGFVQSGWLVSAKRTKANGSPALVTLIQPETLTQAGITVNLTIE